MEIKEMKILNIFEVANYFIKKAQDEKVDEGFSEGITHLRLQKILYFAQCACLAIYNKPLFNDEIQAWQYGPVINTVYQKLKVNRNKPLKIIEDYPIEGKINEEQEKFLKGVWELFSKYSTTELVNITHRHTPWKDAWNIKPKTVIKKDVLTNYYKNVFVFRDDE
jgi:uncharacterized phage-associated protein